jgi:hypothetical protein
MVNAQGFFTDDPAEAVIQGPGGGEVMQYAAPGASPPVQATGQPEMGMEQRPMPSPESINPYAADAAMRMQMHDWGYEWRGGQAGSPAQWVPIAREDAIAEPDAQFDARQQLAENARGIARDERDIRHEENQIARNALYDASVQARDRAMDQEARLNEIDRGVQRDTTDLDNQMRKHRDLIAQGTDPWRAFGGGDFSSKMAAVLGVMTSSLAGGEAADRAHRLVTNILNQELQQQQYAIETQGLQVDNSYGRLRDSLGDKDQAKEALRVLMLDHLKYETERSLLDIADPQARLEANKLIQQIDSDLLMANDAFRVRGYGKLKEAFSPERRASSGGWAPTAPDKWMAHLDKRAGVSGKEAGTQKTYTDIDAKRQEMVPGANTDKLIGDVPTDIRKAVVGSNKLGRKLDRVAKMMGMGGYDMEKGKFFTDAPNDIEGVGWLDAPLTRTPLSSENARNINRALEELGYAAFREDHGANYTGIEQTTIEPLKPGGTKLESNVMAALTHLGDRVADTRNSALTILPRSQQQALMQHLSEQSTPGPETLGLREK